MKYLILFMMAGLLIACNSADQKAGNKPANDSLQARKDSMAQLAMKDSAHFTSIQWIDSPNLQLPKITEGQVIEISWRFKNSGTTPLVIENVSAGCGCTVAQKPKEPIAPNGEDVIKAKFDSKGQHIGSVTKNLTVTANTKGQQSYLLTFSTEITK